MRRPSNHQVNLELPRDFAIDAVEKTSELRGPVAAMNFTDDLAARHEKRPEGAAVSDPLPEPPGAEGDQEDRQWSEDGRLDGLERRKRGEEDGVPGRDFVHVSQSSDIIHMKVAIESGLSVTWRRRRGSGTPAI